MGRHIRDSKKNTVIIRDGMDCYLCGQRVQKPKKGSDDSNYDFILSIDHVIPLEKGGSNRNENLKVCCLYCNNKKNHHLYSDEVRDAMIEVRKYRTIYYLLGYED